MGPRTKPGNSKSTVAAALTAFRRGHLSDVLHRGAGGDQAVHGRRSRLRLRASALALQSPRAGERPRRSRANTSVARSASHPATSSLAGCCLVRSKVAKEFWVRVTLTAY